MNLFHWLRHLFSPEGHDSSTRDGAKGGTEIYDAETEAARRDILSILKMDDALIEQKEFATDDVYVMDDFLGVDIAGNLTTKEQAKDCRSTSFQAAETLASHLTIQDIKLQDEKAIVTTQEYTEAKIRGRKTGRLHTVVFEGLWRSVWIKTDVGWKIWRSKQLTQTITRDGKKRVVPARNSQYPW